MRLLWARVGIPYSPATGLPIEAQQVSQMVDRVMSLPDGSRHYLLAPVVRGRKGEYRKELAEWQKAGFTRVRIDGEFYDIEDAPALDKKYKHDIEIVVDRIVVREGIEPRLADSFETALKLAEGLAYLDPADPAAEPEQQSGMKLDYGAPGRIVFSEKFACPVSGFTIAEIEPRLFSFNAPQGACPACDGLGEKLVFDEDLVVPNHALSIKKGAVVPWAKSNPPSPYYMQVLSSLARAYDFDLETPWGELPEEARDVVLHGTKGRPVTLRFVDGRKSYEVKKPFEGVIGNLNRRMLQTESAWMREELSRYQSSQPCEVCHGARLKPEALSVKIAGEDISMSTRRSSRMPTPGSAASRRSSTRPSARSRTSSSRRSTRASASSTMSGSTISTSTAPAARSRAARASASASPRRSAPASRASSTSSTNLRSASTRRTTTACSKR
jgi:excinuclease ABC subunit A